MTVVYQEIRQNGAETPDIPTNCILLSGVRIENKLRFTQ